MTDIQKEYCEEKGLIYIKPENTEIADYVNWLEAQIQTLRIHNKDEFNTWCEQNNIRLTQVMKTNFK